MSSTYFNESGRRPFSNFSDRASLISCDNDGKNYSNLSINSVQGMDVNLYFEWNMDTRNLLLFYKQKIILIKNRNSFLLNQNNFLQNQIDQNNKIILNILNNNSLVESDLRNSNNNLQKSNKKNPLVGVVKENVNQLPKSIKVPQRE